MALWLSFVSVHVEESGTERIGNAYVDGIRLGDVRLSVCGGHDVHDEDK